jgi:hypothetical protein
MGPCMAEIVSAPDNWPMSRRCFGHAGLPFHVPGGLCNLMPTVQLDWRPPQGDQFFIDFRRAERLIHGVHVVPWPPYSHVAIVPYL